LVHSPTFVPVVVHVAALVVLYDPLKVCPVAAIDCVSYEEHPLLVQVLLLVPVLVQVADLVVDHEPYECPNTGMVDVDTISPHFEHLPTFVPVSVHVASFVVVYEPLKECPVAAIVRVSYEEHPLLVHILFSVPVLVQVAYWDVVHEPYECPPNEGIVTVETVAPQLMQ